MTTKSIPIKDRKRPAKALAAAVLFSMVSASAVAAVATHIVPKNHHLAASVGEGEALLRRTGNGIVHVTASNYKGIGFGVGYAYTEDNRCLLAYRIAEVNGRLSEQVGANAPVTSEVHDITYTSLQSDHYYKGWFNIEKIRAGFDKGSPDVRELAHGYMAGVNRYIKKHPHLPECKVNFTGDMTLDDVYRVWVATASIASGEIVAGLLPHSAPPRRRAKLPSNRMNSKSAKNKGAKKTTIKPLENKLSSVGSNAWAIGRDGVRQGNSVHLYNPHFPWAGPQRQYMIHITIPGELDVMGVTLGGFPVPFSGFTEDLAWGLTFSSAARWTLADLKLERGPLNYRVDGHWNKISTEMLSINVLGEPEPRQVPFYRAGNDPIIDSDAFFFGWWNDPNNPGRAYAAHDVNADNTRIVEQFLRVAQSKNVYALKKQLEDIQGVPWSYVVASDSTGDVYFSDVSAVPNVTAFDIGNCVVSAIGAFHLPHGIVVLDGAREACHWKGLLPAEDLPVAIRSDYLGNSNNTYELPHLEQRLHGFSAEHLDGFSPILGNVNASLDLRAVLGLKMITERLNGTDRFGGRPGFTRKMAQKIFYQARNHAAELLIDGIVADCKMDPIAEYAGQQVDLTEACRVLESWDRKNKIHSRGAVIFRGMWTALPELLISHKQLFLNKASSLNEFSLDMPSGYTEDLVIRGAVKVGLARTVIALKDKGIPLDVRWGDVHKVVTPSGGIYPISGGRENEGIFDSIVSSDSFYSFDGWVDTLSGMKAETLYGASYLHAVSYDHRGMSAVGVLTYSQATEKTSPWYHDQVRGWSKNRWLRFPFSEEQIKDDLRSTKTLEM